MPIVSTLNLISFLLCLAASARLGRSYRETGDRSVRLFFFSFLTLGIFFLIIAAPGLLSRNGILLGYLNAISVSVATLSALFFAIIPLMLLHKEHLKRITIVLLALAMLLSFGLRLVSLDPLVEEVRGPFSYWVRVPSLWTTLSFAIGGIALTVSMFSAGFFFVLYGIRNRKNSSVFIRALTIGVGVTLFAVTALVNYLIGAVPSPVFLLIASAMADLSILFIAFGVFYKAKEGGLENTSLLP
ncbi:hypothetical protein KKI17_00830 [Patescibacteria group bacterium]|nr:hypothetical protein [Patescibacteria group bacterium]